MTADNKQFFDEQPLSRREYREQLARQQRQGTSVRPADTEPPLQDSPEMGRRQFASEHQQLTAEQKTAVLRRKLNIAIVALLAAIIAVYLILFFVG